MKEHSQKLISDVIEVLDRHVSNKEDVEYPTASACSQFLKDICKNEGVTWEK